MARTKKQSDGGEKRSSNGEATVNNDRLKEVEKAVQLMALARSEGKNGNIEAARTAAWKAVELMGETDIIMLPKDVFEHTKKEIEGIKKKAQSEKFTNMAIGALLGKFLLGNVKL